MDSDQTHYYYHSRGTGTSNVFGCTHVDQKIDANVIPDYCPFCGVSLGGTDIRRLRWPPEDADLPEAFDAGAEREEGEPVRDCPACDAGTLRAKYPHRPGESVGGAYLECDNCGTHGVASDLAESDDLDTDEYTYWESALYTAINNDHHTVALTPGENTIQVTIDGVPMFDRDAYPIENFALPREFREHLSDDGALKLKELEWRYNTDGAGG